MRRKASKKGHQQETARSVPVSSMTKTKGEFQNLSKHRLCAEQYRKSEASM